MTLRSLLRTFAHSHSPNAFIALLGLATGVAMLLMVGGCHAVAGRAAVGFGVSVAFIAMLKIVALSFDERRFATVTGLCMLIGNLGSVLAGAPLAWLAQTYSWRHVFAAAGLLSLLVGLLSRRFVADIPAHRHDRVAWLPGLLPWPESAVWAWQRAAPSKRPDTSKSGTRSGAAAHRTRLAESGVCRRVTGRGLTARLGSGGCPVMAGARGRR
jgi:hypothetical protein